ncbi:MAG TPA: DUF4271 domain-containing protein [Bacteroidales bacterium]|jgi:MFS family permease|nr:DUF4271 domain-containing protein [Bacteroidales bacterium]MDI9574104.1 DUF4271 domain-containing protein [Bacteroidota bacterium]OQC61495.1 MAG: hypothetical protein BWX51_00418 [Bacteroidetes bacterium ADurb.Bin012]MBP9510919.1 DUF4271 domain-containing protein [Bacteroidales bacterium]MBP9587772.1 DUF4271 domain-containing protein [Bacteroidales bacterium]
MPPDSVRAILIPFADTFAAINPLDTLKGFDAICVSKLSVISDTTSDKPISSFFTSHTLISQNYGEQKPIAGLPPWISLVFLLSILLLIAAKLIHGQNLMQILKALFSRKKFNQLEKDIVSVVNPFKNTLLFNAVLMLGLLVFMILQEGNFRKMVFEWDIKLFGSLLVFLLIFFLFKSLFISLIGSLIHRSQFSKKLLLYFSLILSIIGVSLFPILALAIYLNEDLRRILLMISIAIVSILYLFQIIKWTQTAIETKGAFGIYFFSYLCTVEFLLQLILLKAYLLV